MFIDLKTEFQQAASTDDLWDLIDGNPDDPDIAFALDSPFADIDICNRVRGLCDEQETNSVDDESLLLRWFAVAPEEAVKLMIAGEVEKYAALMTQAQIHSAMGLNPATTMRARILQYYTEGGHAEAVREIPIAMTAWQDAAGPEPPKPPDTPGFSLGARRHILETSSDNTPYYIFGRYAEILLPLLSPETIGWFMKTQGSFTSLRMMRVCHNAQEKQDEAKKPYPSAALGKALGAAISKDRQDVKTTIGIRLVILSSYDTLMMDLLPSCSMRMFIEQLMTDIEEASFAEAVERQVWTDDAIYCIARVTVLAAFRSHLGDDWSDQIFLRTQRLWPAARAATVVSVVEKALRVRQRNPDLGSLPLLEAAMSKLIASPDAKFRQTVILSAEYLQIAELSKREAEGPDAAPVNTAAPVKSR